MLPSRISCIVVSTSGPTWVAATYLVPTTPFRKPSSTSDASTFILDRKKERKCFRTNNNLIAMLHCSLSLQADASNFRLSRCYGMQIVLDSLIPWLHGSRAVQLQQGAVEELHRRRVAPRSPCSAHCAFHSQPGSSLAYSVNTSAEGAENAKKILCRSVMAVLYTFMRQTRPSTRFHEIYSNFQPGLSCMASRMDSWMP